MNIEIFKKHKKPIKKKKVFILISILLVVILAIGIMFVVNPLRRPTWLIKKNMLSITPEGMNMEAVLEVIKNHEKLEVHSIQDSGFAIDNGVPIYYPSASADSIIGEKSIKVLNGKYNKILPTYVWIFYAFDENEKLIYIQVYKETDFPP